MLNYFINNLSVCVLEINDTTIILKKKIEKKEFLKILESITSKEKSKQVNTMKYCGTIKLKKDALSIQKEMRDEWN